jgi:RND superfamily putative drug exporter
MTLLLYRLGRASVRLRRFVLLGWVLVAIGVIAIGTAAGGESSDAFDIPGVESQRALDVLEERFPDVSGTSAQVVFAVEDGTIADAGPAITAALDDIAGQPDVSSVGELQQSADGRIAYADVQYSRPVADIKHDAFERLEGTVERATSAAPGLQVELGGELPSEASSEPPGGQEIFGLVAAIIVLLLAFGSVIAMGLPIVTALTGLAASIGLITVFSAIVDVNSVAPVLASMIGLGVGIDYALFIVTRHRENLHQGMTVEEAAGRAIATSGAAVLFAGMTVVIAICGLAIAGIPAVTVMGLMSGLTVAVMVAISLTLLPALLGFAGHKIDSLRLPGMRRGTGVSTSDRETVWHRWGRHVSARPWTYLVVALVALGTLAAPLFSLRLGMTDNGTVSESLTTRRAYDLLGEGFGAGFNGPLVVSVELDGTTTADGLAGLTDALAATPGVQSVAPPQASPDGTAAIIRIIPESSPQDEATSTLVHHLRDDVIPTALAGTDGVQAYVGGQTASFIDLSDKISGRLFWFIGAVILLSVLLLTMVFRSIAVPLKAAAMNLLSIGAAYGVIVAVFQWGWLKGVFGVEETIPIVSFVPMMMFAILFGLSMDYEVFLLSRVREEYLHHRDNTKAVIEGISATARVITSAALIMISVFAAFILGDDPTVKMFGLGLAVAVFVDATIVRIVLVPATMRLLGDRNWWLPGWLDRILPNLDVEGGVGLPAPEYEPGRGPAPIPQPDGEIEPALA